MVHGQVIIALWNEELRKGVIMSSSNVGRGAEVSENNLAAVRRIQARIAKARTEGRPVCLETDRLIAACVHRGLASELQKFASTGVIPRGQDYKVMRLELDLTAKDEPQIADWVAALKEFFTNQTKASRSVGVREDSHKATGSKTRKDCR